MDNATREEVYAITNALDESLHLTHEEALDMARFSEMQNLRNRMHGVMAPPALQAINATYREMQPKDEPIPAEIPARGIVIGLALSAILWTLGVALVVSLALWMGWVTL